MTWIFQALLCKQFRACFLCVFWVFSFSSLFLIFFFLSFFSPPLFFVPSTPTPWRSNSHLGQEHILKSKFLCQSVLMLGWLRVTDSPAKLTSQGPETAFLDVLLPLQCFRLLPGSLASSPRPFLLFLEDPLTWRMRNFMWISSFKKSSLYIWSLRLRNVQKHSFEIKTKTTRCIYALNRWRVLLPKANWRAFYELSCLFLCNLLEGMHSSSLNPPLFERGH